MMQVGGISLSFPNTLSKNFCCEFIFLAGSCFASYPPNCHSKFFKDIHQTLQSPELLMGKNSLWNLQCNKPQPAKPLDASELRRSQALHCSLPTAYPEVTSEFAPSFNLPQRRFAPAEIPGGLSAVLAVSCFSGYKDSLCSHWD